MWFLSKETSTNKAREMIEAVRICPFRVRDKWRNRFNVRLSDTTEKTFFPTTEGVCMYEIELSGCIVFNFHRGEGASHTFSGLLILPQRSRQFIATPFPVSVIILQDTSMLSCLNSPGNRHENCLQFCFL